MARLGRFVWASVALIALLAFAGPAAGGPPDRDVIDLDDPALEAEEAALLTRACGTEIDVDLSGRIIFLVLDKPVDAGVTELNIYGFRATFTNPETGATLSLHDVGPDVVFVRDGKLFIALTGRSTTGSGVIGRVVVDLETNEVVLEAGKPVGDYVEVVCEAVT
jgi:hypothetical protein